MWAIKIPAAHRTSVSDPFTLFTLACPSLCFHMCAAPYHILPCPSNADAASDLGMGIAVSEGTPLVSYRAEAAMADMSEAGEPFIQLEMERHREDYTEHNATNRTDNNAQISIRFGTAAEQCSCITPEKRTSMYHWKESKTIFENRIAYTDMNSEKLAGQHTTSAHCCAAVHSAYTSFKAGPAVPPPNITILSPSHPQLDTNLPPGPAPSAGTATPRVP
jgi:hypothetical protein